MAKSAAPLVSPTNRMPSGPKASGPADFRSGFPCLRLAVGSAAAAIAALKPIPASAPHATRIAVLVIGGPPRCGIFEIGILLDIIRSDDYPGSGPSFNRVHGNPACVSRA